MIVLNKNLINPPFDIIKSFHITLLLKELNFKGKFTAIKRSKAMQIILFPTSYICNLFCEFFHGDTCIFNFRCKYLEY